MTGNANTGAEQADLFVAEGPDVYRIPSVVVSPGGAILALASRRKGGPADFGHDTDVVLRRSLDGGETWQPMQTLASQADTDIHNGPAVVERSTQRIFKLCRYWPASGDAEGGPRDIVLRTPYQEMARRGLIDHTTVSDDDGKSWSEPEPLVLPYLEDAVSCATGNGNHGIQLTDGRLLIQGGYAVGRGDGADRRCCVFISDDQGRSWQMGAAAPVGGVIREFGMMEVGDGRIYFNFRNNEGSRRLVGYAGDRGESFGKIVADDALVEPCCHASVVRTTTAAGEPVLLFSNPATESGTSGCQRDARRSLTVRASFDEGRTWPVERLLNPGRSAYSDLAITEDGTVFCLYEKGDDTPHDSVTCARFPLEWLIG